MPNVLMQTPSGAPTKVQFPDGSVATPDVNGNVSVPPQFVSDMLTGGWQASSTSNNITAFPSGGQASAVLLTAGINRVTTIGTAGDSVKLPPSFVGAQVFAINADGNSMNCFPSVGESINLLGANAALAIGSGKVAHFVCANVGTWHSILSA